MIGVRFPSILLTLGLFLGVIIELTIDICCISSTKFNVKLLLLYVNCRTSNLYEKIFSLKKTKAKIFPTFAV
jgi:hypothetical protein